MTTRIRMNVEAIRARAHRVAHATILLKLNANQRTVFDKITNNVR